MFSYKPDSSLTLPIKDVTEINLKLARSILERRPDLIDSLINDEHLSMCQPTLLHIAIWNYDEELFNYLINRGANIEKSFEAYGSPLHLAVYKATKNLRIIECLIQAGAPINKREFTKQWTPLHIACYLGRHDIIMRLIRWGANVNSTISNTSQNPVSLWNTPLHVAIEFRQSRTVELLCELKANVNLASVNRGTPLLFAVATENCEIAQILINRGADINYISTILGNSFNSLMSSGEETVSLTALHVAVLLQNETMVETLLNNKASVFVSIDKYKTSLHCAVTGTRSKIVYLLLNAGAGTAIHFSERIYIQNWIRKNHSIKM